MTPTWLNDIRFLFTQYDAIKMRFFADLSRYEDVKRYAKTILLSLQPSEDPSKANAGWSRLPNVHVMPKYGEPWSQEKLALFQAWIDAGSPHGEPQPGPFKPSPELPTFLALSQVLTGFDGLDRNLPVAQAFLERLTAHEGMGTQVGSLLSTFSGLPRDAAGNVSPRDVEARLLKDATLGHVARTLIELWYTAAFLSPQGFPTDAGTPDSNQYIQGLAWQAGMAHPMGFSSEEKYWAMRPEDSGQYTGLWPLQLLNGPTQND